MGPHERRVLPATTWGRMGGGDLLQPQYLLLSNNSPLHAGHLNPPPPYVLTCLRSLLLFSLSLFCRCGNEVDVL